MSPPETSTPKMATRSWISSATSIKAVPPSAWSPTTLDTPTTPSAPSISSMEELLKRPNRLHYEVMQRSHEAQPVSLGTDGWPTEDILDATRLPIVRKSRRTRNLVRSRKSGCRKFHQIGTGKRFCIRISRPLPSVGQSEAIVGWHRDELTAIR